MNLGFIWRMAVRDTRASVRRLTLLALAIASGVAALVAINGFTGNLRSSVAEQARSLLGADLALESRQSFGAASLAMLDSVGGAHADVVSFTAMTYALNGSTARLAQVSAVGSGWPFYGNIVTEPASSWVRLQDGNNIVVDPSLLAALGAGPGDSLSIGEARFRVIGTLRSVPGDVGIRSAFGPRVFIPVRAVDATQLLGAGSRAEYGTYVRLDDPGAAQRIAAEWRPRLRSERVRVRTAADDRNRLDNALTRLGNFLGLVALIALLLGGLGVASAINVHIRRRLDTVAILRCLGASSGQVFGIYLTQATLLGLAGGAAGALVGLALQQLVPAVLSGLIPSDIERTPAIGVALGGLLIGGWVALAFALLPLLQLRRVSPLAALRRDATPLTRRWDAARWLALAALSSSVLLLAIIQAGRPRTGLMFAGAIGIAILALGLTAEGIGRLAASVGAKLTSFTLRQGVLNLRRPGNQTAAVVLSLGFGTFLLAALQLTQYNLLAAFQVGGGSGSQANVAFFDIQPGQLAGVVAVADSAGAVTEAPVPIVPMRIASVKGIRNRMYSRAPRDSVPGGWAMRREYRSTWRDSLVSSEKLVEGKWWPEAPRDSARVRISIERDVAEELGVSLGDAIVWDVQGIEIASVITSIREVDWARFEPNFFVVFEPGTIGEAPHTWVSMARVDNDLTRGRLPRTIAERWPNVTSLDLTLVQRAIAQLVDRVTLAIRFMALFSLAAGGIVLLGAVATSRDQRVREGALLRTLGASTAQLDRIIVAEYVTIGLMAGMAALGLAIGAGWGLAHFLFDVAFHVPALTMLLVLTLPTILAGLVGLWASRDVVRHAPLVTLRRTAE